MKEQLPKGILIDVDGALANLRKQVSKRTAKALLELEKKNIKVGVCTGRHYAALVNYILPFFPTDSLHVVAGGGQIITQNGEVVWQKTISHVEVINICTKVEDLGGAYVFGKGDVLFCSKNLVENISQHPWGIKAKPANNLSDWSTSLISVLQINEVIRKFLQKKKDLTAKEIITSNRPPYFDITAKGVNKGQAALIWAGKQSVAPKDILAVGDSINDLELLTTVGQSVAMGQSPPELKAVAQKTIQHTDEDGLAVYLESIFNL